MAYAVADVEDIPYTWGTFKFVRQRLGATAFGFAQIDFPPGKVGSEHDETESGQEEVYLTLSGGGTLDVDGEQVEMRIGEGFFRQQDGARAIGERRTHVLDVLARRARDGRAPQQLHREVAVAADRRTHEDPQVLDVSGRHS
jgi:uncharacterized cupin superfamily protein